MKKSSSQPRVFSLNAIFGSYAGTDGLMPAAELANAMRAAGLNPTEAVMRRYAGRDSQLNYDEFREAYEELCDRQLEFGNISSPTTSEAPVSKEAMIRAIGTFDTHGSGLISIQELRFILTGLGDKLSDAEFDDLRVFMRTGDGSGQIAYEQFISNVLRA